MDGARQSFAHGEILLADAGDGALHSKVIRRGVSTPSGVIGHCNFVLTRGHKVAPIHTCSGWRRFWRRPNRARRIMIAGCSPAPGYAFVTKAQLLSDGRLAIYEGHWFGI